MNTTIVLHEVAHSQHFQRIRSDKGFWGALVFNETRHTAATFGQNYYGSKGDNNWQVIALAEGWANYREWKKAIEILRWNSFSEKDWTNVLYRPSDDIYKTCFPEHVGGMFDELQ